MAKLRQEQGVRDAGGAAAGSALGWQLPSSRELKWLLLKPVANLDDEQYESVRELCRQNKEVTLAYGLITDFAELVRNRRADELSNWVELALASGVSEMQTAWLLQTS